MAVRKRRRRYKGKRRRIIIIRNKKKKETIGALERRIGKYAGKIHASDLDYIFPLDFLDTPCFPSG